MAGTAISFGGTSLQTANILTQDIKHAGVSAKRAQTYSLSHANSSRIPFVEYPNKPITITGTIIGSSIADCDTQIDTFNSILLTQNGNLDIAYNGGTRRYVATATNIDVTRPNGLTFANFTVTFTCTQPFGQDTNSTTAVTATGRTSSSFSDTYTFIGTAPYQQPVFTVTFTANAGSGNQTVSVGNAGSGQVITVNRPWASTDVLIVDCVNNVVTVNGLPADFSGAFPLFPPGSQTLYYLDSFTSRTFNYNVAYNALYL
jgi:hypothetical protein